MVVCLPILLSSSLMATLSSISLLFISLFALVVALALSRPVFPSVASNGGGGFFSVLDARGGVTIAGGSFSGLFAPFDGGDVPTIVKSGVGFPSGGLIADNLVLWPTLLAMAAMGYFDGSEIQPAWVLGFMVSIGRLLLWLPCHGLQISSHVDGGGGGTCSSSGSVSRISLHIGLTARVSFCWACILGLVLGFIFYFYFCYPSFFMDDGVTTSSVV